MSKLALDSQNRLARAIGVAGVLAAGLLLASHPLRAQTQFPLYSFCYDEQEPCPDGAVPWAGLIQASDGNLYGTTDGGGTRGGGSVFVWTLSSPSPGLVTLYSFCTQTDCTDGQIPMGPLIQDIDGNLYGTTNFGGANGYGTVFKITPYQGGAGGTFTSLYSFCSVGGSNCTDGENPEGSLAIDSAGNLYGTTYGGGAYGDGTIFEISPTSNNNQLTASYSFGTQTSDGAFPRAGPILGSDGNLYGTTSWGGVGADDASGIGTVFEFAPGLGSSPNNIYVFCISGSFPCPDGQEPYAPLFQGTGGLLYGTTYEGGVVNSQAYGNYGTLFSITQYSPTASSTFSQLYVFCQNYTDGTCLDGDNPYTGVIQASDGNLYGTTQNGGSTAAYDNMSGSIFEFNLTSSTLLPLYDFCGSSGCATGSLPRGGLVQANNGIIYGTTSGGGAYGSGTIFSLGIGAPGASLSPTSLNFGNVLLSTPSTMSVTLTNTGSATLSTSTVSVMGANAGDFSPSSGCSNQTIATSSSCTVSVTFTPSLAQPESATLLFPDNGPGNPQMVGLSGTGTSSVTQATVPNVVGDTELQAADAIETAGLTVGTVTVASSTTPAGEVISESPAAGTLVSPGSAVNLTISSGPPDQEIITVTDTDWVTPLVNISAPVVYFSAGPTIGFGGGPGLQTLTASDIGLNPLTVNSFTVTGQGAAQFSVTLVNCSNSATSLATTLPSGGACAFNIAYTPSATPANDNATLAFTDSASLSNLTTTGASPSYMQSISLSGSGSNSTVPGPPPATVTVPTDNESITVSDQSLILVPNSINFGEVPISSTSSSQTVTLANAGSAALAISEISAAGNFSVQTTGTTCGSGLSANATCTISVIFTPKGSGTITGTLTISIPGNPQTVTLSGTGVTLTSGPITPVLPPPPGTVSPGQPVNPTPVVSGGGTTVSRGAPGREITPSNSNLVPLAPATTITVAPNVVSSAPAARFSASTLTFAAQTLGTTSPAQTITLTNSSNAPLAITSITAGGDFTQTDNCGESVAAGDSCTIKVIFKPAATGTRTGALTINKGAPGATQTIPLNGIGKPAEP